MPHRLVLTAAARFVLGAGIGVVGSFLTVGPGVFRPSLAALQAVGVALMLAGVLTLVRVGHRAPALAVALAYGVARSVLAEGQWNVALAGLFVGLGTFVVAEIYDELGRRGLRFGKFLLVGPLLGGVLFAVAPLSELGSTLFLDAMRPLMQHLWIGIVVGDGVGLGVEVAELLFGEGGEVTERPAT